MQVLLRAMLIHAVHAALEDREVAFDGVGVNVAAPYSSRVLDGFVCGELLRPLPCRWRLSSVVARVSLRRRWRE